MTRSGTTVGTVIRWDDERQGGLVEAPDLPGECWVDGSVVEGASSEGGLRAGQIVEVDWTEPGAEALPCARPASSGATTCRRAWAAEDPLPAAGAAPRGTGSFRSRLGCAGTSRV